MWVRDCCISICCTPSHWKIASSVRVGISECVCIHVDKYCMYIITIILCHLFKGARSCVDVSCAAVATGPNFNVILILFPLLTYNSRKGYVRSELSLVSCDQPSLV